MWTVEDGIRRLQDRGAKITAQRIAILKRLEGRTDHPSADRLFQEVKEEFPTLSIATIYSTTQILADAGLLKVLSIDEKRVYFDPGTHPHGHFLCTRCGRLLDVGLPEEMKLQVELEGAQVDRLEFFLYGVCPRCL